jgi:outer membrane lipoprotein SlyB
MKRLALAIYLAALAGCAVVPQANPSYSLIDPAGVDQARYSQDYNECAALANQTDVADRAAAGAVAGAIFGALLGSVLCGRGCVGAGMAGGALGGSSGAATAGVREQHWTLRSCLAGRGYSVIR